MSAFRRIMSARGGPLGVAMFATAATFLLVHLAAPAASYPHVLLFERSWIQPGTTFAFWLTMSLLLVKLDQHAKEDRSLAAAVEILNEPQFRVTRSWRDAKRIDMRFAAEGLEAHQESRVFRRFRTGLDRLDNTQSTTSLEAYFRTRSDGDADELDTSYTSIRYLIWLIPTLGFIGTVLGIGSGIAGFSRAIEHAQNFGEVRDVLPTVTAQLGTAFDTTLLALSLSVFAAFLMSYVSRKEEAQLERLDSLSFDRFCALFEEHSLESERLVEALGDQADQIRHSMSGNRDLLTSVIREELPGEIARVLRVLLSDPGFAERIARAAEEPDRPSVRPHSPGRDRPTDGDA